MILFTDPNLRPDGWYWVLRIGNKEWQPACYATVQYKDSEAAVGVWQTPDLNHGSQHGSEGEYFEQIYTIALAPPSPRRVFGLGALPKTVHVVCKNGHTWETYVDMAAPNQEYTVMRIYCPKCSGLYLYRRNANGG